VGQGGDGEGNAGKGAVRNGDKFWSPAFQTKVTPLPQLPLSLSVGEIRTPV